MKNIKRKMKQLLQRYFPADKTFRDKIIFSDGLKICSTRKTLEDCLDAVAKEQRGAYMRFGDGDIVLSRGGADLYQVCVL